MIEFTIGLECRERFVFFVQVDLIMCRFEVQSAEVIIIGYTLHQHVNFR
jgi:hypothetical protein